MVGFLDILRFVLCCDEGDRVVHEYQTIPESVQHPQQWKSPLLNHNSPGPSSSRNYSPKKHKPILIPPPQTPSMIQKSSTETQTNVKSRANSNSPNTATPSPLLNHNSPGPSSSRNYSPKKQKPILLPPPQTPSMIQKSSTETQTNVKSRANSNSPSPRFDQDSLPFKIPRIIPESLLFSPAPPQKSSSSTLLKHNVQNDFLKTYLVKPQENSHSPVNQGKSMDTTINKSTDHKRNPNPPPKPSPAVVYDQKPLKKKPQVPNTSTPFTSVPLPPSIKPPLLLSLEASSSLSVSNAPKKTNYIGVQKDTARLYSIPEDLKEAIEKDIVPQVLRKGLTPSTYKNYFVALLYAEDFYCEKWSAYCLKDVTLELHEASIYMKFSKNKNMIENGRVDKLFVAFEIDSVPEKRPFLLSRDFVLLQPSGKACKPFRGLLYRVVKGNRVLAEFGDDFHLQHSSNHKYNVSFTFNRVCLKRCHQALAAATETLFHKFLFPSQKSRISWLDPPCVALSRRNLTQNQVSTVYNILRLSGSPPFLVEGPLSATGLVIQEAVLQIYKTSPSCRILINGPTNSTCDMLMRSLMGKIPESEIFRANAAFREQEVVPDDILPLCPFEGECFRCPPLHELRRFKVVLSTYMSSFRLHNEGISAGHFSHIFLVDASSTMEPETMVVLANLVNEKTVVVVTGAIGKSSGWVRSKIARGWGLKISYFERLLETEPYCSFDPEFVVRVGDKGAELENINRFKPIF